MTEKWIATPGWIHLQRAVPANVMEEIRGKYLFFCPDQKTLKGIAESELADHGFFAAKVSSHGVGDFVLCLYWFDDSRKIELSKRYPPEFGVKYRYWKSDADTLAGKYSQKFIDTFLIEGEPS